MPNRVTATLLAIACTALAAATPPSTAAPASDLTKTTHNERVVDDATFDVMQPSEQNGAEEDYVPAADRTTGDITKFEVRHARHRVRFRIAAQELLRPISDDTYESVFAGISARTDDGDFYAFIVLSNLSTRTTLLVGRRDEEPRPCPGKTSAFDEASDTITISLPRQCLSTPRWVKAVASVAYSWPGGGDSDYYGDYAPDQPIDGPLHFTRRAWHPTA